MESCFRSTVQQTFRISRLKAAQRRILVELSFQGKYDVAMTEFHTRVGENAVSVFYPADKRKEENATTFQKINWLNYEKDDKQI